MYLCTHKKCDRLNEKLAYLIENKQFIKIKQNMQKNTKLKIYISPTVKMVSFTVERGFAGSDPSMGGEDTGGDEGETPIDGINVTGYSGGLSADSRNSFDRDFAL